MKVGCNAFNSRFDVLARSEYTQKVLCTCQFMNNLCLSPVLTANDHYTIILLLMLFLSLKRQKLNAIKQIGLWHYKTPSFYIHPT